MGLYVRFHRTNITGVEVVEFLRQLQRHLRRPIVLLWDGGTIHQRKLVQEYLASRCSRYQVYRFPAYAPELNPDEYVWSQSKRYLSNATPRNVEELNEALQESLNKIGSSQRLLKACLRMSTLSF